MNRLRAAARWALGVAFVAAGVNHFLNPDWYLPLIPPVLPAPAFWNAVAGTAELAGGLGLFVPKLRRAASWGLIALLVGLLWVHVEMLARPDRTALGRSAPAWVLWGRLPFQGVLIVWAWWAGRPDERPPAEPA